MNLFLLYEEHWKGIERFRTLLSIHVTLMEALAEKATHESQHKGQIAANNIDTGLRYVIEVWETKGK